MAIGLTNVGFNYVLSGSSGWAGKRIDYSPIRGHRPM